jgi:hypothetical protein
MNLTQSEFETLVSQLPAATHRPPKPRPGLNATNYTIALASALQRHSLRHPLFFLLTAIGRSQAGQGHATIPALAITLSVTFQAIDQHVKKHDDLIASTNPPRNAALKQITLTPAGIDLLVRVTRTARNIARRL